MSRVRTTCPYCGVGCGLVAEHLPEGGVRVSADADHPANLGRICVKGAALGDTVGLAGRQLYPEVDGVRVSWDAALETAARKLQETVREHGPQAVAFYASGQLLTEDYYVANKLMKGFIGAGNIDTNSRLCMASAVVGYKRAFGADVVPCSYRDLEQTDLIVLVGSNAAWTHPVLYQRIAQAKQDNPALQVVVVDPRRTATCDIADLHLRLAPGSDAGLYAGLLRAVCEQRPLAAAQFAGQEAALASAQGWSVDNVAHYCDLDRDVVTEFYRRFVTAPRAMTLYTMGINQSSTGSDKCNAIINAHLASGQIGRVGCGPFSLTGQPNAMGGREVGGLANQLACHMQFVPEDIARLGRFWGSERIAATPGLMAVELFDAIERGEVKAVWIMGTNPAVSLPGSDKVNRALAACPLVIVSEVSAGTDTGRHAHIRFPALAWGEKNGTVTNSERRISRQRPFMPPPGEARADWWILAQVARGMGYGAAFGWQHPHEIFCEHAALSGFENAGRRAFDISGLADLTREQYDQLSPVQWPVNAAHPQGSERMLTEGRGWGVETRLTMVPVTPQRYREANAPGLVLNTGRYRDQWHTMTRTGTVPRLMQHSPLPRVAIHPEDARRCRVTDGQPVKLTSPCGMMTGFAQLTDDQSPGTLFAPMHWNRQFASESGVNSLVAGHCDPHSGQPESKQTAVTLSGWTPTWQGWLFSREPPTLPTSISRWRLAQAGVTWLRLASDTPDCGSVQAWAAARGWQLQVAQGEGMCHLLAWQQGELQLALYVGSRCPEVDSDAVLAAFAIPPADPAARHALLAGRVAQPAAAAGRMVCSCMQVGENAIREAIEQGCDSAAALGRALRCGTHCGSCIPELRAMLAQRVRVTDRSDQSAR
ncbi:nitrate reductase [Siccibacter turicensis]|uniref:nitrate reductase n=1 Tax=Siccibacter turicensis TaxID=357233 RepID=UPI003F54D5F4